VVGAIAVPLGVLALVISTPRLDERWENHPAHFWLVLTAAAAALALASSLTVAARRRRDARLFLVSLAFVSTSGFLGLHALATPGVLLGKNAGFELATPVGLLLGGAFVALSGLELDASRSAAVVRRGNLILAGLLAIMGVWAFVSLAELPPLDEPVAAEQLDGWQAGIGVVGVALYGLAAAAYARIYLRRRARFAFATALSFGLLAEAMVVVAFARNWRISWWEWHVLMLAAVAVVALAARSEWHEERFSAIYLDKTLAGVRDASILFADLQGYTSFTERSGPTAAHDLVMSYFERLVPLMESHGGEVHQLIGDAMMVIFNQNGDQPDHAPLAARAALALQREAGEVAAEHPDWPRFRVGVNSGEVVAAVIGAESGHRKHGLVGDTVNLAARLESIARVDSVVIGEGTYERLPPGAVVERLAPLELKGKSARVDAYLLHALPENGAA
jgi:adenylate cyclase